MFHYRLCLTEPVEQLELKMDGKIYAVENSPFDCEQSGGHLAAINYVKVISARIRRMGEGNVFTGVCPSIGGLPQSQVLSQVTGSRSFPVGGTPVLAEEGISFLASMG